METWRQWRHGDMETWRHGDVKTWGHGDKETWRHQTENGKWKPKIIFLNPFTVCSSYKRKFVVCYFANKETYRSYPFTNGLN
jgi:hypothetical protein